MPLERMARISEIAIVNLSELRPHLLLFLHLKFPFFQQNNFEVKHKLIF